MSDDETTTELKRFRDVMREGTNMLLSTLPSLSAEQYTLFVMMLNLTSTDPTKAKEMLEAVEASKHGDYAAFTALVNMPLESFELEHKIKA
jgi:hypothetical protein